MMSSAGAPQAFAATEASRTAGGTLPPVASVERQRLNATGRNIALTVPVMDGLAFLGDIALTIQPDDELAMPAARLLVLVSAVVSPETMVLLGRAMAGQSSVGVEALMPAAIGIHYDPQKIELALQVPARLRLARSFPLVPLARERFGDYEQPAALSAYLNIRGAIDYVERGTETGFAAPVVALDGAMRLKGVVLETQGALQPGAFGPDFQRQGSRLVYDDQKRIVRWTAGDLRTIGRGFQSSLEIAGLSVFRSYSVLQPQTIARPTGRQSFRLERASMVEISVNGRVVRRVRLEPGPYDLRDFPVTQGIDKVSVAIQDDTGRNEVLQFDLFFDQTQLAEGLKEFGLYAGVKAPLGAAGPDYTNEGAISGFYRQGVTERLTAGANLQADRRAAMAGAELVLSTSLGSFGANVAGSHIRSLGTGVASILTFLRMDRGKDASWAGVKLTAETWSERFGPVGTLVLRNPHAYRIGGSYTHGFNEAVYAGVDLQYAKGRADLPDSRIYRALIGWRPTQALNVGAEVVYQRPYATSERDLALRLSLTWWLDSRASLLADYDTRQQTARAGYQTRRGEGVGSYHVAATLERTRENIGINAAVDYLASVAELGVGHLATFGGAADAPGDSRSVLRIGSSVAFADGALSIGRPIHDSFAIITRHQSLGKATVTVNPTPNGYTAATTMLGTATAPDLSSYSERTITIDAPLASPGVDLGRGAFRLLPPYRSGYRLMVGSDYFISLVGRLLDADGAPLALVAGDAIEQALPSRPPIELFTNRDGRFGLAGVKPGRWQIRMLTDPPTRYTLDIQAGADDIARVGNLTPLKPDTLK